MFERRELSSPEKVARSLLSIKVPNSNIFSTLSSRATSANSDEKKSDANDELKPRLSDVISLPLGDTYTHLVSLTDNYLWHIKTVAAKILSNCPLDKLKEIQVSYDPLLALEITVSGCHLKFDCKTLLHSMKLDIDGWIDNPAHKIIFKKLNHVSTIFHCLHSDKVPGAPQTTIASKITAVKIYIEKKHVGRDLRTPRTDNVLPGDSRGGVYMKSIISYVYDSYIEVENLIKMPDIASLNRQTSIRLEWYILHYLNLQTDYTMYLLKQLPVTDLNDLHDRSAPIKDDNRFILIEHPQAPDATLKDGGKEFKIHCSILESSMEFFPNNKHYHLKKCANALNLLVLIEEVNTVVPDQDKITQFFEAINEGYIRDYMRSKTYCYSLFWSDVKVDTKFLSNVKKIEDFHNKELLRLEQENIQQPAMALVQA
jgi:hypothetical protein